MERLTQREGRLLAALVEKQLTIPQHYPLTLPALTAACNQATSRDPVTSYGEEEVLESIESLKAKRLVRAVLPSHGRSAVRYRHVLDEALGLDAPQLAVLAVLELRGPQTGAELRARTERMATFDSVEHELELLASGDEPLAERLGRRRGQKEERWAAPLTGAHPGGDGDATGGDGDATGGDGDATGGDVGALRREVAAIRDELGSMREGLHVLQTALDELRTSLGG